MKIAQVDPSLFTVPYDEALCRALTATGSSVTLYGRPLRKDESAGLGVRHVAAFYPYTTQLVGMPESLRLCVKAADHVASSLRFLSLLQRERPDIIHFQWSALPLVDLHFFTRLRQIAPMVLTVHDSRPFNERPSSPLQRLGARKIYDCFDRLIVHTALGLERLVEQGVSRGKLVRIAHGPIGEIVERQEIAASPHSKNLLNVLLIGKLKPYKGADVLIRAISLIPEAIRERARFIIAGKPYIDVEDLFALSQSLGVSEHIHFDLRLLSGENFGRYIDQASILAFPYREIEASGVFFAALNYGKPIVASRLGCFAELLEDGVHGHLVDPDDPAALARALTSLISDDAARARMALAVSALGRSVPSWNEIASETLALYADVQRERALQAEHTNLRAAG